MEKFLNTEWFAYLCALIGPFIQEDAAVLGAASASVSGIGTPAGMFIAITIGPVSYTHLTLPTILLV